MPAPVSKPRQLSRNQLTIEKDKFKAKIRGMSKHLTNYKLTFNPLKNFKIKDWQMMIEDIPRHHKFIEMIGCDAIDFKNRVARLRKLIEPLKARVRRNAEEKAAARKSFTKRLGLRTRTNSQLHP